jgi:phage tail sheath protein FI
MPEYLAPGIYAENVPNASAPVEAVSSSVGALIGVAVRGKVKVPVLITSWQDFLDKFAYGMDSPFLADSDLAYSVYGFFQNGGTRAYIVRAISASGTRATVELTVGGVDATAKDEGTWGNSIKVIVSANVDIVTEFDVTVKYNDEVVEVIRNCSNTVTASNYFLDKVNGTSRYIDLGSGNLAVVASATLVGGADGVSDIIDADFSTALDTLDSVDDVSLICMPGQTSAGLTTVLKDYCDSRKDVFGIFDAPKASDATAVKTFRKAYATDGGMYYPWIRVIDPLSKTGKLRDCPTAGHTMGVYARTISERGTHKNPAGTEAVIRGAIEVVTLLSKGDIESLNPAGVNCIVPKANYGVVIWGARSMSADPEMKYVADLLLDKMIKKSVINGTQWAVFEPNDDVLWMRVRTAVEGFLDGLWRDGALFGTKANEAYFVKCDADLNPKNVRDAGKLIVQVGYAGKKPAEFVIFKFSHNIASN